MDLVIVRENTEGFYSDRNMFAGTGEFMPDPDSRALSPQGQRPRLPAQSPGPRSSWRRVDAGRSPRCTRPTSSSSPTGCSCARSARSPPSTRTSSCEELIVDATAALLIRRPQTFDVIVTTNMFGDILSDEASELSGSLGLGGSINAGDGICVAQAQHGSAPDIAGQGIANPTSLILSAAMLLDWRGRRDGNPALVQAADLINRAVDSALDDPATRTRDIGGGLGTAAFAEAVRTILATDVTTRVDAGHTRLE